MGTVVEAHGLLHSTRSPRRACGCRWAWAFAGAGDGWQVTRRGRFRTKSDKPSSAPGQERRRQPILADGPFKAESGRVWCQRSRRGPALRVELPPEACIGSWRKRQVAFAYLRGSKSACGWGFIGRPRGTPWGFHAQGTRRRRPSGSVKRSPASGRGWSSTPRDEIANGDRPDQAALIIRDKAMFSRRAGDVAIHGASA